MNASFSDEAVMAFADGELPAEEAARIALAAAADPALAERIEAFRSSRAAVADLFSVIGRGPAAIRPLPVRRARPVARYRPMAIAAAIVLAIALPAAFFLSSARAPAGLAVGGPVPEAIASVLDTVPSGGETAVADGRLRLLASFRPADGALCREFELDGAETIVAFACRAGEGWHVTFGVAAAPTGEGYAPASSQEAFEAYLASIEAGDPLERSAEAAALSR